MDAEDDAPVLIDPEEAGETTASHPNDDHDGKVPCTLISGFLGAGKSTFLKRVLTERHGQRIAVIMNEFGDSADIEGRAINVSTDSSNPGEMAEDFLELPNGCLCCSIKDTGVAAIEKLMQKKGSFDYILLETTGLADPGPIASMFWQNEEYAMGLGADIYLDGVVCVVDAVFGEKQMEEAHSEDGISESLRQIACADVVLLNKSDIVSEKQLRRTEQAIRLINPLVPIHRTIRGEVDLKLVIGLNAYAAKPLITDTNFLTESDNDTHVHDDSCDAHAHAHELSRHGGISSLRVPCPMMTHSKILRLDEWIRTVLWEGHLPEDTSHSIEILRCKGAYTTSGGEMYVLQGVRNLYEMNPLPGRENGGADVPQMGKLVFIGKGLTEKAARSLLEVFL